MMQQQTAAGGDGTDQLDIDDKPDKDGVVWMGPKNKPSAWASKDKLNLAGLLNVLDGVVDSPGRILVRWA